MSKTESTELLDESTDGSPSSYSPPESPVVWWRAPERVIAVSGAIGLTALGRLPADYCLYVLLAALSAPVTSALVRGVKRLKSKGSNQ
jgi:hypothetical protein